MSQSFSTAFADSKPHYHILDGLRGVAAIMVIWYHIFEAFATSPYDQHFNHGYLAVDFFFILSGFVVGYAYDERWRKMSVGDFFRRRLIRLQPMVVMGALLVWLGASGLTTDKATTATCNFLGNISYPLYMVHYPFMYLYYAWVWRNELSFAQTWPVALLLLFGNIVLAWLTLKFYDEPLRKWLTKRGEEKR